MFLEEFLCNSDAWKPHKPDARQLLFLPRKSVGRGVRSDRTGAGEMLCP